MRERLVLRVLAKFLIPFILLFALYVQAHGDYGPGGGFQAGVIFASAFILYGLVFGLGTLRRVMPDRVVGLMVAAGVILYAGVGLAAVLLGANYLDYGVLAHEPAHGRHYGIFTIELGVGITVSGVMLAIFYAFAGRGETERD